MKNNQPRVFIRLKSKDNLIGDPDAGAGIVEYVDRLNLKTKKLMNYGYKKLFPLRGFTIFFIGVKNYKARTRRLDRYLSRVLRWQNKKLERAGLI